ncbi:putative spermidine/putrescine transport system ATP-binding protein [Poseidonocella pacifica]|uniref:Putative spermidine/putrescine transport system ATP-binding protein n=1 Tax=Poseidonocella pacifica TaxID=871651 RepID=A0A1I0YUV6_9RHOB|nr:ABC transporter ATP-binding protein [Poseidonocella pacifica]SFB17175.1 putative spermidine/putrescine transport system ATP-binding protein [Poseidonocella pacifica]
MTDLSSALTLSAISKTFGPLKAVDSLDLSVEPGALVSLLGPSGCGKTTTLRMVAGFDSPDSGTITIGGEDMTRLPPNKRGLGMVFQSYSLFPHRTVGENIAFGLRMGGASKQVQDGEVRRMLDMVHLAGREDMYPAQLSGGQQQRVALARALVVNPRVLLLDEPLGALDKSLRESMQFEIREMQQRLGITALLVTHDQEEAMSMSDKIAVMHGGRILQLGAPNDIYDRPETAFVATFLGNSNLFEGRVRDGVLVTKAGALPLPSRPAAETATLSVRPERVVLGDDAATLPQNLRGRITAASFRGAYAAYQITLDGSGTEIIAYRQADTALGQTSLAAGAEVRVGWPVEHGVIVTGSAPKE